jgi:hypothetical protein
MNKSGTIDSNTRQNMSPWLAYNLADVNYAPPKGGELVMLPMFPWQAYSTIGRLTDALPSRFSECRRAAS